MTTGTSQSTAVVRLRGQAPWALVLRAAAALAASMGIGRFAYTPILPLMHTQAGLSAQYGSALATANYAGYLAGALLAIVRPAVIRSVLALRTSLVLVVVTLALMGATENQTAWLALRLIAGIASALVFMIAVSALLTGLHGLTAAPGRLGVRRHRRRHRPVRHRGPGRRDVAHGLAGLGGLRPRLYGRRLGAAARATPVPSGAADRAGRAGGAGGSASAGGPPPARRWFAVLLTSYSLEGVGYIIAGTFLVAAINENSPAWAGSGAWVLAGLAAIPASVAWSHLSRRWTRPTLLCAALLIQAAGIALPALVSGVAPALVSAVLFGATFLGVASMALALGAQLRYPRAVALLTTGYGLGQILGPLVVTPLLHHGYHLALLIAAAIVLAAALAAAVLRIGTAAWDAP